MSVNPTIVFTQPRYVAIEEREIPSPKQGELLIKTGYTLISTGTELTILNGEFPQRSAWARYKFPFVPGYDNIGKVLAVGKGVNHSWIGQEVASCTSHSAYVVSATEKTYPIKRKIDGKEATFFTIAQIVMNGLRQGKIQWGEAVAVYGLGLLGQLAVRLCWLAGARPVIGVEVEKSRLDRLPDKLGIVGINPQREDAVARTKEITRKRMVDVVFEVTGNPNIIPEEFRLLRSQGRFVVLSSPRGTTPFDFHDLCSAPSFTIIGAHNNSHPAYSIPDNLWTKARHVELFFDLVANGDLEVKNLISHCVSHQEALDIYNMLLKDRSKSMGVVLKWS